MQITTHGDYLVQLTRLTAINCFLVREEDGFTLVDTGMSGSAKNILDAAQHLGAPIRRITLTHAHVDHVGSLDALHALLPDAEVSISGRDARFLTGDRSLDPNEPQVPLHGGYPVCTTHPDRLLQPGDRVGSLEVLASPGHTPGHVSFLDVRDQTLIAGDVRWLFPLPAMATWDKTTALHSAEALVILAPSRLAVGHGKTLEHPIAEMEKAIAEARRKIKGVEQQKVYS
jgi:glyoxylase-like metal-dependent hydrolase (beta-lactamase superfamily II)